MVYLDFKREALDRIQFAAWQAMREAMLSGVPFSPCNAIARRFMYV